MGQEEFALFWRGKGGRDVLERYENLNNILTIDWKQLYILTNNLQSMII